MKEKRRKYSASRDVPIVGEFLEGNYSSSELNKKYHIHLTQLIRWKKQPFESAVDTFNHKADKLDQKHEKEVEGLRAKLPHLARHHLETAQGESALKRSNGD